MIFKSKIYQENGIINAEELYKDIEKTISFQKEKLKTEKLGRKHPLQHILNSTSGNYVAPTSMKSFELCPASYLYSKLVPEIKGSATSVGSTVHKILQLWYDSEDRSENNLEIIKNKSIKEDNQESSILDIDLYIKGYLESKDYIGKNRNMDHQKLVCSNEVFIKPIISPLGVNLNVPVYVLIDRIDIRDEGIFVIDYKTGFGDPNPYLLGENGYLPQMIFYKWSVEAEYGEKIKKVFLCLPGAETPMYKYTEMNVNSLVEQSKVIEQVSNHLEHIRKTRETKLFECKIMRYCTSCQLKHFCSTFIKNRGLDESTIKNEIEIEIDLLDKIYE